MKTLVFHSIFFALIGLILSPLAVVHASPPPADSTHFCQLFDFEQWERDHVRPAAKRLLLVTEGTQESGGQPEPPYGGTVWIDPDIITPSDPTALEDITAAGRGERTMFDRRVNDWISVNAYLFDARFDDGLTAEIQVNPEFGSASAALAEANKYGRAIGQLPTVLRTNVETVWIHKGDNLFGGGNNNILIHVGQVSDKRKEFLEEILVHEAAHTSLDPGWKGIVDAVDWRAAQMADGNFISDYARDHPEREDIAESFLSYLAVRYRSARISLSYEQTILETMPNRIAYFDRLLQVSASDDDMYPITEDLRPDTVDDEQPESASAQLAKVSGDNQQGLASAQLARPFVVSVLDQDGSPLAGVDVTFSVTAGGGTLSATTVITNTNGRARSTLTLGSQPGINTVTASVAGLEPETFTATAIERIPHSLTKVSGEGQEGPAGEPLAESFVVSVLDQSGSALAGAVVTFSVTAGGGTLSATTATTDANGRARSTLTLGSQLGTNTVEATVAGLEPVTFTATATEQMAHSLTKVSGDGQEGPASTQLAEPFVVSVLDQDGSPLAGAVVSFSVTAGGGTLSSTTATTDANGRARTTLTLGSDPGPNTVAVTVEGLGTATFTATAGEPASDSQEDPEPDPQLESLSVTIDDVTSTAERGRMTFTVRLEPTPIAPTTVKYATASQTATAGQDYESATGMLHFGANQNTATFTVRIRPDEQAEPNETFAVRIRHPSTGARLAEATGTITDDDGAPSPEGDSDGDERADSEEDDGEIAFGFSGAVEDQAYTASAAISVLVLPEAIGGEGKVTYKVFGLPAGLSFDATTRTISGTPAAATDGAVEVTYTAQDSTEATATLAFSITVNPELSFGDLFDLFN